MKHAVPKTILQLMNVDGMTRENVASHLQVRPRGTVGYSWNCRVKVLRAYTSASKVSPQKPLCSNEPQKSARLAQISILETRS